MSRIATSLLLLALVIAIPLGAQDFTKTVSMARITFSVLDNPSPSVSVTGVSLLNGNTGKGVRMTLPDSVQRDGIYYRVVAVESGAFCNIDRLNAVTMPASVNYIADSAIVGCANLCMVRVNCDSLSGGYNSIVGCGSMDTLVIGTTVRYIAPFMFSTLKTLTTVTLLCEDCGRLPNIFFGNTSKAVLVVGENVRKIPDHICYNFEGLERVEYLSDRCVLDEIGECSFLNCRNLRDIVLPQSLRRIGGGAFSYCSPTSIVFASRRPPAVEAGAFNGVNPETVVFLPCYSRGFYANSAVGRLFHNLEYADSCYPARVETEVVYMHDTVVIHDTVVVYVATQDDDTDKEDDYSSDHQWLWLDGRDLRIIYDDELSEASFVIYDDNGDVVQRLSFMGRNYDLKVRLPKKQRYYLHIQKPGKDVHIYVLDVQRQEIR